MSVGAPHPYQVNIDVYHRMFEAGLFNDRRVELLEGKLVEYGRKEPLYCTAVALAGEALRAKASLRAKGFVTACCWLKPTETSLLQPDVALLTGAPRDYADRYPTTAKLIVEIGQDSLAFDQNEKASLYAKASIADYWIVNLVNKQVEVYRRPIPDAEAEFGFNYADKFIFQPGEKVKPLAKPKAAIAVADLLP